MKIKKRFCPRTNGLANNTKKFNFPFDISGMMKPIKRWRANGNVKLFQRTSEICYCDGSFHKSIYPVMVVAQCFGVMPVINISSKCPSGLMFTWKSFRYVFAVMVMMSCGLEAVSSIVWTFRTRVEFGKMVILVYYITNFLSFICFLRLAKIWPDMMVMWHDVEKRLPQIETKKGKGEMCVRIRRAAAVILIMSAVEHILSIVSSVAVVLDCPRIHNILEAYYVHNFPQVFTFVGYSHVVGFFVKLIHVTSTFVWSFTDLFIIMVSCGLSAKFKLINEQMFADKGQLMPPEYWNENRSYYRSVCDLVAFVDEKIDLITILSISNNLFFICVQLLNSVDYMTSFAQGFYFWFSLIYLIVRTLAVSLYSAEINDESKRPLEILRAIPRESWCLEIKRFTEEVNYDVIALSGKKFFFLTRRLVLSVAGTIITYELVLIQFNTNDNISDYNPCRSNITTLF